MINTYSEKIVVCYALNAVKELFEYLQNGYRVKHCVAENAHGPNTGRIVFVLSKESTL